MGRLIRVAPNKKKEKRAAIRLSEEDYFKLKYAMNPNETISKFVRRCIDDEYNRKISAE